MGSDVLSKISPLRWWLYVLFRERKSVDGIPMTCTRGHWISTCLQSPYGGSIPRAASLWKGKSTPNHATEAIHETIYEARLTSLEPRSEPVGTGSKVTSISAKAPSTCNSPSALTEGLLVRAAPLATQPDSGTPSRRRRTGARRPLVGGDQSSACEGQMGDTAG